MDQKELILKAIDYVNDIPKRVEEFLDKEKLTEEWDRKFYRYRDYLVGCDPFESLEKEKQPKKKLPKTRKEALLFVQEWNDFKAHGHTINDGWIFLDDYEE